MKNGLIWTATSTYHRRCTLKAQCKSSKTELLRRIRADDPCWVDWPPVVKLEKRWPNKHFSRGLAFRAFPV